MATPAQVQRPIRFGEGYELDLRLRRLCRGNHVLKLERIPLEILVLLVEHKDEIVTRDEIVVRVWGKGAFLDTDNGIRGAIRKLRQALKDDAECPQFIQTVTGQGYRFIAPVVSPGKENSAELIGEAPVARADTQRAVLEPRDGPHDTGLHVVDEPEPAAVESPVAEGAPVPGHRHARTWVLVGVAALAILAIVALPTWWRWRARLPAASQPKTVLAVLPFDNLSGDADQEFFSDGLTDEMISQIGKLNRDRLVVIARSSIAKYKDSKQTAKEIGRELNADYLLQGSVRRSPDRVRITVELIDAKKQTDVWTESYDRELRDVLAVQDSVVGSIANEIHIVLTEDQKRRLASSRKTVPEAYVAYLKGRYYWNKRTGDSIAKAEQYFQQAIDRDPNFAAAYSGLADCNSGLAWHGFKSPADSLPKAYAAARKAIEIDPESAEAHASLGLVLSHRWEWAGAEAEFRRALELDPQYANAHHWYGDYLSMRGRHDEALAEARRALELDPLNLMISTWVGLRYYLARNYSAASQQNRDSVELDPNFAPAHLVLGEAYVQAGLHDEAVNELTRAASLSGDSPLYTAQVAIALAAAGRNREALQIAHELEANAKTRYVSPYGLAQIFAALKMDRETFRWLQAALDDHAVWIGYLAVDPIFDRYRSDARFQELLRRVGLN